MSHMVLQEIGENEDDEEINETFPQHTKKKYFRWIKSIFIIKYYKESV